MPHGGNAPITTKVHSDVEQVLRTLGPDAARPESVMELDNLTFGLSGHTILEKIEVSNTRSSTPALLTLDEERLRAPLVDLLTLRRRVRMLFQRVPARPCTLQDEPLIKGYK